MSDQFMSDQFMSESDQSLKVFREESIYRPLWDRRLARLGHPRKVNWNMF